MIIIIVDCMYVALCNHSVGHIGGMGGIKIETCQKSRNPTHKKDDGERECEEW